MNNKTAILCLIFITLSMLLLVTEIILCKLDIISMSRNVHNTLTDLGIGLLALGLITAIISLLATLIKNKKY